MAMRVRPFVLESWYSSEDAKRRLGPVCKTLNLRGGEVQLLGSPEKPLLVLADADDHTPAPNEVSVTLDEARANWSAITIAALLYGTTFRIHNNNQVARAVLSRHPQNRHPAVRYQRSTSADVERIVERLNALVGEVRKLGAPVKRTPSFQCMKEALADAIHSLRGIAGQFDRSAELIDRRFREAWRLSDGLPSARPH